MHDVLVVGGGITGLAAAWRAVLGGASVLLLEASARLGGKLHTDWRDGCLVEHGADGFLARKPGAIALAARLGLADALVEPRPDAKRVAIRRDGRLHALPPGLDGSSLLGTPVAELSQGGLLSPEGFRRAREARPLQPRHLAGTVADALRWRSGSEAYDWLLEPLYCGIVGGDGDELGLLAAHPALAHGAAPGGPGFRAPRDGMRAIPDALAARLPPGAVRTHSPVARLEARAAGWRAHTSDGASFDALQVILALPSHAAASILPRSPLTEALTAIPHASSATVTLALADTDVPDTFRGHGFLVPRADGGPVIACGFPARKYPGRARPGIELVRVFLGGRGREAILERDDAALVAVCRAELAGTLGCTAEPHWCAVARWPQGMPQYTVAHAAVRRTIRAEARRIGGLEVAGASYDGVGIPACIRSGWRAAARIAAPLEASA